MHGKPIVRKTFAFVADQRFSSDSNLYIECMNRVFQTLGWQTLPKELYVQMDNTASTNKNTMYAFRFLISDSRNTVPFRTSPSWSRLKFLKELQ